jgi:uncharacterized protein
MEADDRIRVEVVYALAHEQAVVALSVSPGATVEDAIELSGLRERFSDARGLPAGVHGKVVAGDTLLKDGDRVEIYRPLIADAKQARRRRAGKIS